MNVAQLHTLTITKIENIGETRGQPDREMICPSCGKTLSVMCVELTDFVDEGFHGWRSHCSHCQIAWGIEYSTVEEG